MKKPTIFFCYAKEDKEDVDRIYHKFKEVGLNPWMDKPPSPFSFDGIGPGERWETKIKSVIQNADIFLAFLSKKSVSKHGFVQREYRLALDRMNEMPDDDIFLIPVLLEPCQPPNIIVGSESFEKIQWYELYKEGLGSLIEYIKNVVKLKQDDIHLGKRLVVDFGTSSLAIANYKISEHHPSLSLDIGAGTTDIAHIIIKPYNICESNESDNLGTTDNSSDLGQNSKN